MKTRTKHIRATVIVAVTCALCSGGKAQSVAGPPPSASPGASRPAPTYLLYHLFFRHLTELHKAAGSANGASASPAAVDRAILYKHVLALKDSEYNTLLTIAKNCEDSASQDDAQAREIINQTRSRYPGGKVPAGESLPALPDSLKLLQNHRDATINNAIASLNQQMSFASRQQIDRFIRTHLAPRSEAKTLAVPHKRKAGNAAANQ